MTRLNTPLIPPHYQPKKRSLALRRFFFQVFEFFNLRRLVLAAHGASNNAEQSHDIGRVARLLLRHLLDIAGAAVFILPAA